MPPTFYTATAPRLDCLWPPSSSNLLGLNYRPWLSARIANKIPSNLKLRGNQPSWGLIKTNTATSRLAVKWRLIAEIFVMENVSTAANPRVRAQWWDARSVGTYVPSNESNSSWWPWKWRRSRLSEMTLSRTEHLAMVLAQVRWEFRHSGNDHSLFKLGISFPAPIGGSAN